MLSSDPATHDHEFLLPVIQSLKNVHYPLDHYSCNKCYEKQQNRLLASLGKWKHLRCLTITGLNPKFLTPDCLENLSQDIIELKLFNLPVAIRGCRGGYVGPNYSSQVCAALLPVLNKPNITTFSITIKEPFTAGYKFSIDEFVCGIADKWKGLKSLNLAGIHPPSDGIFLSLTLALRQVERLILQGYQMVTDENIVIIAGNLKTLTDLRLLDGSYTPSGIKALCGHPSISELCIAQSYQYEPNPQWVLAVYDVILSLPKITYLYLQGKRVIAIHASEKIPPTPPHVHIEVENSDEYLTRSLPLD